MMKGVLKEASLLVAFVVLAGLLLLSLWISENFNQTLLRDFRNTQVTMILKDRNEGEFKSIVDKNPQVMNYKLYKSKENKDRLGKLYPELSNVINPLEEKFFPVSAVVTVKDADAFLQSIKSRSDLFETQIIHRPPYELQRFIRLLTILFSGLWLLTLTLVLYFNLERLAVREMPRWSLMKMLGERPMRLFAPLWVGQSVRVLIGSFCAMGLALLAISQIQSFFAWNWNVYPWFTWSAFFVVGLAVTVTVSYALFYSRYRRVALG